MIPEATKITDRRTHKPTEGGSPVVLPSAAALLPSDVDSQAQPADTKHFAPELIDTPVWCITTPPDCRARAEEIVGKIEKLLGACKDAGPTTPENTAEPRALISYLMGWGAPPGHAWEALVPRQEINEIRGLLRPHILRDETAVSRFRIDEHLLDNKFDKATEAIRVQLAEQAFFDTREAIAQPFVRAVDREEARQELILRALKDIAHRDPTLCPRAHFEEMAFGNGRVLSNAPLIGPDIWGNRLIPPNEDSKHHPVLSIGTQTNRNIAGYTFKFGFFETRAHLTEPERGAEGPYKIIYPLISLDERVFTLLSNMGEGGSSMSESAADQKGKQIPTISLRILKGIRDLSALGGHDTWHHLFYGLTFSQRDRFNFNAPADYFHTANITQDSYGAFDLTAFELRTFSLGGLGFGNVENHALLSHRAVWKHLVESTPKLTNGLISRLGNFVADLTELKGALIPQIGVEEALRVVKYLTIVALDQVALILPQSTILKSTATNRDGDTLDQAIVRLGLPSYDLREDRVVKLVQRIVPDAIVTSEILKKALGSGASDLLSSEVLDLTKRLYKLPEIQLEEHKDLHRLFSMLILLDLSSDPQARQALATLAKSVEQARGGAKRPTKELEMHFKRIATKILGVDLKESPQLKLNEQSAGIFIQAANESLERGLDKNSFVWRNYIYNFVKLASIDPIFIEALPSIKPLSVIESPHDVGRYLFCRIVDAIRASTDHKLSGLHGLMAEDLFSQPWRIAWIDGVERIDPIDHLHRLQQMVAGIRVDNRDSWRQAWNRFEDALDHVRLQKMGTNE